MLYERWLRVAGENANTVALRDLPSRQSWTFQELVVAAERIHLDTRPVAFPSGMGADFILTTLAAWRMGRPICPLETTQAIPPALNCKTPDRFCHFKVTSATTGAPRLVAFRPEQLAADAENIVTTMKLKPDLPNLGVISLAHSYGFSNLVLPLLLHGIPLILVGSGLPQAVRHAGTIEPKITLAAVPALWRTWHEANAIPANVGIAISAGAPLPIALERAVLERSALKIHNFYGSSECGGIAYDASREARKDGALAGEPMLNVLLSTGSDGCLEVRGAAVGECYWPDPAPALSPGLFKASDLADLIDGHVYLRGRAGDRINVAGRKVLPDAIERVLLSHPQVKECLVFGVPSTEAERGDIIVACLKKADAPSLSSLRNFLAERLPAWQIPREWWLLESLAANERGKFSRAELRARFLNGRRATCRT